MTSRTRITKGIIGRTGKLESVTGAPSPITTYLETKDGEAWVQAMRRRVGETPAQRLSWLVQFSRRDLSIARPEELTAAGHDLRMIAVHSLPGGSGLNTSLQSMPPQTVVAYQEEIRAGLRRLLNPNDGVWTLHELQPVLYMTSGPRSPKRSYFGIRFEGDERAGILGAMAQVIQAAGEHLRACRQCGLPFVAAKRQEYCSPSC